MNEKFIIEMSIYDSLAPEVRKVLQEMPFGVVLHINRQLLALPPAVAVAALLDFKQKYLAKVEEERNSA